MRHSLLLVAALALTGLVPSSIAAAQYVVQPAPAVSPRMIVQPRVDPRVRAQVRAQLAARRALNLQRLETYARRGAFPDNHVKPGMLNVMIDDEGKICAAASLMARDGLIGLVQQTAQRDNFLRFVNVHEGPLLAWMLSSGFTQEEIDQIQEPYDFIPSDEPFVAPQREDIEKRRLQARFRQVATTLRRSERRSLDVAVDRLLVWRAQHGVPLSAVVQPTGDPSVVVATTPAPVVRVRVATARPGSPLVWAPGMPLPGRR